MTAVIKLLITSPDWAIVTITNQMDIHRLGEEGGYQQISTHDGFYKFKINLEH